MEIKGADGAIHNVASNSKGDLGVALGAVGTGLSILNGAGGLFGMGMGMRGMYGGHGCGAWDNNGYGGHWGSQRNNDPGDNFVTRHEQDLVMANNAKDSEIALLKSEKYTDQKLVEVYNANQRDIRDLREQIEHNRRHQDEVNKDQAIFNEKMIGGIKSMKEQLRALDEITDVVVPRSRVCRTRDCECDDYAA
ncbi:MAG: hypothetical protein MJZ41_06435 [Bacteroidaceae bacterium]|nr:hypothetical protein [Bacteroidaceae bacterium]